MSAADNKKLIALIMAELAKGNTAPYAEAMAEDFVWRPMGTGAWAKAYVGKKTAREKLFAPLYAQYRDQPTTTAHSIFADGDFVVVEAQGAATMKDGRPYNNRYCFIMHVVDGKIHEVREYLDTALADRTLDASVL
jgi:ketosteroid isomerase-like protein